MLTTEELIERILELALIGRPNKGGVNFSDIALAYIVELCEGLQECEVLNAKE